MSTKYTLKELIDYGLVSHGDALTFTFKGHTFTTQLQRGGILAFCEWNHKPVFHDRSGFTSLTDWSDTCIQECLHEFVTRFSSWKRIKHAVTGTPMHMLRSRLWELRSASTGKKCQTSAADELLSERKRVVFLSQRVATLERELTHQRRVVPECQPDTDDNPFRLRF